MKHSRNKLLADVVMRDVAVLKTWANPLTSPAGELKTQFRFHLLGGGPQWGVPSSESWFSLHASCGGPEKIALMLQRIDIDEDGNGEVTDEEYKQNEKTQMKMIDACLAQLLNYGIVAGLTLTVFYPMAVNKLDVSEDSAAFFGENAIDAFTLAYYVFMVYCVVESVIMVYKSTRAYLHLSMWMCNLDMKMWYVDQLNVGDFTRSCFNIIKSVVWSVPMGVAVTVSPAAGVVALLAFLYFYGCCLRFSRRDVEALWFMRQYTAHKLKTRRTKKDGLNQHCHHGGHAAAASDATRSSDAGQVRVQVHGVSTTGTLHAARPRRGSH
jgi:hypothetical protein